MVHPKSTTTTRAALYGYLIGRDYVVHDLPESVRQYEAFRAGETSLVPDVPFQMLTSLPLTKRHWQDIARRAPWQMKRMNLNTSARHDVYSDIHLVREIANRLRNEELIARAKVFPYQLMTAYSQTEAAPEACAGSNPVRSTRSA